MPADKFLPAIGHAVSGGLGTAISTSVTYPLDLVNTRLKVQRQLREDGAISPDEGYSGLLDALRKIPEREGGLGAFYAGLGSDVAKSVADSFLFFLFYTWFRSRRSHGHRRRLPVWEELAVGAAAGACARLFTTPIGNVVTRKQTASLLGQRRGGRDGDGDGASHGHRRAPLSVGEVLRVIRAEKGLAGLWVGYGATLVLTLNPSITFYLQHALAKAFAERGGDGGAVVFLTAALSKVVATAATYPFNIAKARLQVSAPDSPRPEPEAVVDELKDAVGGGGGGGVAGAVEEAQKSPTKAIGRRVHWLAQETIFATVLRIARTEGVGSLYDGLSGELLKAFFNHGTTMLSKDIAHGLIVRLYFFILAFVKSSPVAQALLSRTQRARMGAQMGGRISGKYGEMRDEVMSRALVLSIVEWTRRRLTIAT